MLKGLAIGVLGEKTDKAFVEVALSLQESLPPAVTKILTAVRALDALTDAADKLAKGRNQSGALELTLIVADVHAAEQSCQELVKVRDYALQLAEIKEEWWSMVQCHFEKCAKAAALGTLIKDYGLLNESLDLWEFTKAPWIKEKNPEKDELGRQVSDVLLQFPVNQSVMERIARSMDSFATKEQQVLAVQVVDKNKVYEQMLRPAAKLLAEIMVVSMFVHGETDGKTVDEVRKTSQYGSLVKYIKGGLSVQVEDLHPNIRDRMMGKTTEASTNVAAPPPPMAQDEEAVAPKKKKSKKL